MGELSWTLIGTTPVYEGPIFALYHCRARSAGREAVFDVLDAPDWVNVVALTDTGEVVLIRQFRHGTREVTLEIPGGTVDPRESPLSAARRELLEETGYAAERWEPLGTVAGNPAFLTNRTHTFLATGARAVAAQACGENEDVEVLLRPLADVPGLVADRTITHALVVCAFFHLALRGGLRLGAAGES